MGNPPATPLRAFVGRTAERQALTQRLGDAGERLVSLTGSEGVGKSCLARQVALDLLASHHVDQVLYSSFAGGGDVDSVLYELGQLLPEPATSRPEFESALREYLTEHAVLIIWDHLESLLPEGDTPLEPDELRLLLMMGAELSATGNCRLLMISDSPMPAAAAPGGMVTFPELQVLTESDARALLESVQPPELDSELAERILSLSANLPLAIQAYAALAHHFVPEDFYTLVERAMPGVLERGVWSSLQAHDVALNTLWQALSPGAREKLYGLSIFRSGAMQRLANLTDAEDGESWQRFYLLATQSGLVDERPIPPLAIPYMHFKSVLTHYCMRHFDRGAIASLHAWYCSSYLALLEWIREQESHPKRDLSQLLWAELPNFRHAFRILLSSQQLGLIQDYAEALNYALAKFGLQREQAAVGSILQELIQVALPKEGPLSRPGVRYLLGQVQKLQEDGKARQALAILQPFSQRIDNPEQLTYQGDDADQDRGQAYQLLGKLLQDARQPALALKAYMTSLAYYERLSTPDAARPELLQVQLATTDLLLAVRQLDQAQALASRGLLLAAEMEDHSASGTLHNRLAMLAAARGDEPASRQHAQDALAQYQTVDDAVGQAEMLRHLAMMDMNAGDVPAARTSLERALELASQADAVLLEADLLVRLGSLAAQASDLSAAQDAYMRALVLYESQHVKPAQASTEVLLSELLLREGQYANARVHAEAARALAEGIGPAAQPWVVYDLLERIALAEQDEARALVWRRKSRESLAQAPQAAPILMRWRPLLQKLTAAANGEALSAETVAALEEMEASVDNPALFSTIWQILNGERGSALYEALGPGEAVVIIYLLKGIENPAVLADQPPADARKGPLSGGFSADQFIATTQAALRGDEEALKTTEEFISLLESDQAPATLKDLADVIRRIMAGERGAELAEKLPDELGRVIAALLEALEQPEQPPSAPDDQG